MFFSGKPWSNTANLYYNYQRWYDPSTGRFTSRDPGAGSLYDPQSLNDYAAVLNNPIGYVDPNGAAPVDVVNGIVAGFLTAARFFSDVRIPGTPYWLRWAPPLVKAGKPSGHTLVVVVDESAIGQAKTRFKMDLDVKGYHSVAWNSDLNSLDHDYDIPLGEGEVAFGYQGLVKFARVNRYIVAVAAALTAVDIGSAFYSDYQAGHGFAHTEVVAAEQAAGWAGAIGGAKIGGVVGATLCAESGPGIAVCGTAGAIIGGFIGYAYGEKAVDNIFNPAPPTYGVTEYCGLWSYVSSTGFGCIEEAYL